MSSYYNHSLFWLIIEPVTKCYEAMQPISKFIFCSLNITVKMLIMTKVGQKIVGYIRKAYFDANFSFATYTLQVSLLFAYINSQLFDSMESTIVVGDSQCKYLWRYSNAPLIQAFSGYTFSDFRHSSDIEIQHGFADAKVCEHYS